LEVRQSLASAPDAAEAAIMTTSERFLEIQELFHAALKLPPAERRSFLTTRCPHDQSLRDEVELLLEEDANPSAVLEADPEQGGSFTLPIGTHIGPYEITGTIGAGGMGDVYRAHDSKLRRDVALKVLPENFAKDSERISRFRREAQLLASLNHPNIAAIYGLEESDGVLAIVMELVEGPTLAERMSAGAVCFEEALNMARQMSEALQAAHERGIVHRDFKPANVKITRDGAVKVLDFGLGKVIRSDDSAPHFSATRRGMILGTAPYMSPEQARGLAVDRRTDIWAFGVVLYEMLTGARPFAGDITTDILAAVLAKEPDWNGIPLKVRRMVQRCLEKDPKRRLHDIADVWMLLDEEPRGPVAANRKLTWARGAALIVIVSLTAWIVWRATRPAQSPLEPLVRLDVDLGNDVSLGSLRGPDVILSPDGTRLVYVSQSRLFTRRLDQPNVTELAGTQNAFAPFFSPDGRWVAFVADSKLKKVAIEGGPPIDLCDAAWAHGGSWGADGTIIAAINGRLWRVPADGGILARVTELAPGEVVHRWPQILPGGKAVLFSAYSSTSGLNGSTLEVISMADHRRKTLWKGATFGQYVTGKRLIFLQNGTLLAVPFNPDQLEIDGPPLPVLESIAYSTESGFGQISISRTGTLVYRSSGMGQGMVTVQLIDGSGDAQPLVGKPGDYLCAILSPDGQRLALTSGGDIWLYELKRETMTPLTSGGGYTSVFWSPDGQYIVFRGQKGIFWLRADGAGQPQLLFGSETVGNQLSFTPDGRRLAYVENSSKTGADIWTVRIESDRGWPIARTPEVFLQTPFDEREPAFSPDGHWLAYFSVESGSPEVYVRAFPDNRGKRQISNGGGVTPVWSPNGHELFFRNKRDQIMVARYTVKGNSFVPEKPRLWSRRRLALSPTTRGFDVAPDGKHIVATLPVESSEEQKTRNHVTFLLNFLDEIRRRVPTDSKPIH
jgi:Tol biopolymer transport system component